MAGGGGSDQKLSIEAGCRIILDGKTKVGINSGTLELKEEKGSDGVSFPNQTAVTIRSTEADPADAADNALFVSTSVTVIHTTPTVPLPLYIDGRFRCEGEILLFARRNASGVNDTITAEKQIEFTEDTQLRVTWFAPASGSAFGHSWTLIHSNSTAAAPINRLPICHPPFLPPETDNPEMHLSGDAKDIIMDRTPN